VTKASFATLRANHDSSDRTQAARFVDGETVYKGIGYDMADLLKQSPAYENTCAVRMSLALMRSGVAINGRIKVKSGSAERAIGGTRCKAARRPTFAGRHARQAADHAAQ
jgi:hypothetical protein